MIKLIPFEIWHVEVIANDLRRTFSNDAGVIVRFLEMATVPNASMHTIIDTTTNMVVAIVGGLTLWEGVMEVFTLLSNQMERAAKSASKIVRQLLDIYASKLNYRRFQTSVKHGFPEAVRWVEFLGFTLEGTLRKFGPMGEDYYMFARVI